MKIHKRKHLLQFPDANVQIKTGELSRVQEKTMASIGNIVTCAVVYIIGMLQPKDMWTVRLAAVHLFQPVELDIIARVTADVRKPQ